MSHKIEYWNYPADKEQQKIKEEICRHVNCG